MNANQVFANIAAEMVTNVAREEARMTEHVNDTAAIARSHYAAFASVMSTAEHIGHLSRLVEAGYASDAEECQLLDLLNPFTV